MKSTLKSTLPGSMVSFSFGSPSGTEDGSVRVFVLEENADVYMLDISLISNQRSLFYAYDDKIISYENST